MGFARVTCWAVLAGVVAATLGLGAQPAAAHPLGNFTTNRFTALELGLQSVMIRYVVDMAEIPTFQEIPRIDTDGDEEASADELDNYARALAPRVADEVRVSMGAEDVEVAVERAGAALLPGQGGLDVLRIEIALSGQLPSRRGRVVYSDGNFEGRIGWREIIALGTGGQGIASSTVPSESVSDGLTDYPQDLLQSPLDVSRATIEVAPGAPPRGGGAAPATESAPTDLAGRWFSSLIERDLSPAFLVVAVLLSLAAGALHALGPGHGKTIMAAYLVGADGRARHALAIGVAVSLMHTLSVLALGLVTLWAARLFPPESVFPWLSLSSGLVVLGLGSWLLTTRLRFRGRGSTHEHATGHSHEPVLVQVGATEGSGHGHPHHDHEPSHQTGHPHQPPEEDGEHSHDHSHPPDLPEGDRGHSHGHSHAHPVPGQSPFSIKGLGAVALSGGLLPSPSALVVLLGAVALHRIAFGLLLVAVFSIGLAAALTAVGLLVLKARSFAARRLSTRAGELIPIASASVIVIVGLFLTTRALLSL